MFRADRGWMAWWLPLAPRLCLLHRAFACVGRQTLAGEERHSADPKSSVRAHPKKAVAKLCLSQKGPGAVFGQHIIAVKQDV